MEDYNPDMAETPAATQLSGYLSHIAHLDMPMSAKIEMIAALRRIMESFVNSDFGDDPVQHVHEMHARDEVRRTAVLRSHPSQPNTDRNDLSSAFASPAAGEEDGGVDE